MCSAMRRSAACSASSTPSRCQRTRTGRWSTRCCSGCSTALGCGCTKHSAWNCATSTRPARPSRYATAKTTRTAWCPSPGAWPPRWKATSPPPTPAPNPVTSCSTPASPADKSTIYNRFRRYLADAGIPHFPGGPHIHSLRHGFAVANLRRWAAGGADLVVMLPYLSAYLGHADLRGTQYYLQLTADAHPEVAAAVTARFGYVIPSLVIPSPAEPPGPRQ